MDCRFLLQGIFPTQGSNPGLGPKYKDCLDFPSGSDGKESFCSAQDQVQSLGLEDTLEKEMATHSSILGWGIPWTEEPGRLQSMSHRE